MTNVNEDRARLEKLLTELGVAPARQVSNGVQVVFDGIYATIMIYGDGTLSLLCSVRSDGREWRLDGVNAANNRVRFAKFSVEQGNLLLEADFMFRLGSPDATDGLRRILDLWRMALHELQTLVGELMPA